MAKIWASMPSSEGQRQLRELPESGAAIARAVNVTRASVSTWLTGSSTPSAAMRQALEACFGVPIATWEQAPVADAAVPPDAPPDDAEPQPPAEMPTDVEELAKLAVYASRQRQSAAVSDTVKLKWATLEKSCRTELARRYDLTEAEIAALPAFRATVARMATALEPYPDARRALVEVLANG